jgi:glycine/D-amino acid oxidase-like deaminating enzyme
MTMKAKIRSPWIHQLKRTRELRSLAGNMDTDTAIVGGGIAGIATAYFTLRDTTHNVLLLEANRVAHGATGHNAGQLTSYFERPFASLVEEFGLELAARGQAAVESGWELLDEIRRETGLTTPVWRFTGYAGCTNLDQILLHLKNNKLRAQGGLTAERIYISGEHIAPGDIPQEYASLYQTVPQEYILSLLETKDKKYIAALCYDKGCMNSALFSEEIAGYLLKKYAKRFTLAEETPVHTARLKKDSVELRTEAHVIQAKKVVLCTNGFENIYIKNEAGGDIDTKFHHLVEGKIGYMAGYLEPLDKPPTAISFLFESKEKPEDSYFYLTRRPYDNGDAPHNLLSVGGPDRRLEESATYERDLPFEEAEFQKIETFLKKTYKYYSKKTEEELFLWHGLMGYTPNRVRLVGPEPRNPLLLYNLGCNGVGILPSIYGGKRIADILGRKHVGASIFDPKDGEPSRA